MFVAIEPGEVDYLDIVPKMRTMDVEVLYYGGYSPEAALIIRQAKEAGYNLQLVAGDGTANEDFGLIAAPASDATMITNSTEPDAEANPEVAEFQRKFPQEFPPFRIYAAMQAWVQAVEKAGTLESHGVIEALRDYEFDTLLGRISFDAKGDVTGYEPFA